MNARHLHAASVMTALFWLFVAAAFWIAGEVHQAGIAGAISGAGFLGWGYFTFAEQWDKRHTRSDIAAVVYRDDYNDDLRPVWPAEVGGYE